MRDLSRGDLDRLIQSHRRLRTSALMTVALLVVLLIVLIKAEISFPAGLGVVAGVGIGALLLIPQRRLLAQLGISNVEAREILKAERERRSGVAALPPAERARRASLRAGILTVAGLVLVVVFLVAAFYFLGHAGQTVEEDAPTDPWLGISFFAGFVALCTGPTLLWQAGKHRRRAKSWRG